MTTVSPAATLHAASPSVLQEALPVYDMVLTEHRVVEADVDTLFATARDFDFMTVRSPLVTAMMTARALPSRLARQGTRRSDPASPGLRTWGVAGLAHSGAGSGP